MADKVETGVSGRIVVRRNLGNYNHIEVELQGSKEEVREQIPEYVELLSKLQNAVNEGVTVKPVEAGGVEGEAGIPDIAPTDEPPLPDKAPDDEGEDPVQKLWPHKTPGKEPPIKTDREYQGKPIYECPWCGKRNTAYRAKKGKNAGKAAYSCNKDYGGCGWYYYWEKR
jgi:hypothetical protein